MSPIDDELRAALHGRAQVLAPSPDPLAGIERRAQRIQRHRVGAAVAGSALAVALIAVAVPVVQSATSSSLPDSAPFATLAPSPEPEPAADLSAYALDPERPWDYRGDRAVEQDMEDDAALQWAAQHGVPGDSFSFTPLFGQVYEPSGLGELVYLATDRRSGEHFWGLARGGEAGPEIIVDQPLPSPALSLATALPGDEGVARLLVVASPDAGPILYGTEGSDEATTSGAAPGVGIVALERDPATDYYRVLAEGREIVRADAPDPAEVPEEQPAASPPPSEVPPGDGSAAPSNAIDWPTRGSASPELVEEALTSFARAVGTEREDVDGRLLYGAEWDGRNVLLLAAWQRGQDARTFTYVEAAGSGSGFLDQVTAPGPSALGVLIPASAMSSEQDWLLVVPEPKAGQVLYSEGADEPQPVADQRTEAAVLFPRPPGRSGDRLLILDGNGDPERPIYRGTVDELLAATSG